MKTLLVENTESQQRIYDSLMLNPEHLGIFSNGLAVSIIKELAKRPLCAMDIARKLRQNEQKVYYHLRKMRGAGIVKLNGLEHRYGMTAKIFELVSPVIATKLYEDGYDVKPTVQITNPNITKFFSPFIINGRLNCEIIVGDPYPHGKYNMPATEGPHIFDFAILLSKLLDEFNFPHYSLDTDGTNLKSNLILVGNTKTNIIIDKINAQLPAYFSPEKENSIVVRSSGNVYKDPRIGVVIKTINPFNKKKKLLVLGGIRTRGLQATIIFVTQHLNKTSEDVNECDNIVKIVEGYDSTGNKRIDSIKILE